MKENEKNKKDENNKEYKVIRKFNNEGDSFQKIMEKLIMQKLNERLLFNAFFSKSIES